MTSIDTPYERWSKISRDSLTAILRKTLTLNRISFLYHRILAW